MTPFKDMIEVYLVREWMLGIIVFQAVMVLCIFLFLMAQKFRIERLEIRKKLLEKQYSVGICRYLDTANNQPAGIARPQGSISYEALTEAANNLLAVRDETAKERIRSLLDVFGVVDYYKRMAKSSSWLKRFYAVERLGLLGMAGLKDYFIDVLRRDGSFSVRIRALWALSLVADEEALRIITKALAAEISVSSKFNEYLYTNIIISFQRRGRISSIQPFLDELLDNATIPSALKRDVIEACGSTGIREASRHVVEFFSRFASMPEMKITCIRAAGRISDSKGCQSQLLVGPEAGLEELIASGLVDEDWRVRAVSAGSIHIGQEQVIGILRKLLYDPVFYVRRNAGRALTRLGGKGLAVLTEEAASGDKFVRDNVKFVLAVEGARK